MADSINRACEGPYWWVRLETPSCACDVICDNHRHELDLSEEAATEYMRDPDAFAARFFGLSTEDYYQWMRDGWPLCAAPGCNKPVAVRSLSAEEYWRHVSGSGEQFPSKRECSDGYCSAADFWKKVNRKSWCRWHARRAKKGAGKTPAE